MSAIGQATLGVQCSNKAIGMATLGVFCDGVVIQEPDFTPEPVYPPGVGIDGSLKRRILEDDAEILAVIMAFLQIKDD